MAREPVTTHVAGSAAPERSGDAAERSFDVLPGRLDLATRVVRFMGTTLLVTFVVGLVGALVFHATIIEDQRDLDGQRREVIRLAAETEELRSELAELEAPARIVNDAQELGMIEAPTIVYLTAPSGSLDDLTLTIAANQLRANQ